MCGRVVDSIYASGSKSNPTFLTMGNDYPDLPRFTIVIWGRNQGNFPSQPEDYYLGSTVCVTGEIELFKGAAEIEGTSRNQITIQ